MYRDATNRHSVNYELPDVFSVITLLVLMEFEYIFVSQTTSLNCRWNLVIFKDLIDLLHKSHNAPVPYPTTHNSVTEICTCVHISVTKWWGICLMPCGICEMDLFDHYMRDQWLQWRTLPDSPQKAIHAENVSMSWCIHIFVLLDKFSRKLCMARKLLVGYCALLCTDYFMVLHDFQGWAIKFLNSSLAIKPYVRRHRKHHSKMKLFSLAVFFVATFILLNTTNGNHAYFLL